MQTGVPSTKQRPRYAELDSLRGIAALTVVFYHFRLMWLFSVQEHRWSVVLNPITCGHEAVLLFFLLSGFVLAIPNLRGKGQPYPIYLLRRSLRIYAPYLFALLFAVAGASVWHGPLGHGYWAANTWSQPVSRHLVLAHDSGILIWPSMAV
jgi:peptidoglycan/LPS O-acetylase OafA/YrhL